MKSKSIIQQRQIMNLATDYQNWHAMALGLDVLEGLEGWKSELTSPHYQYEIIQQRLGNLKESRATGNLPQLIYGLREGLHRNLGNLANPELYKHTHVGTKYLIDEYITEVTFLLNYLCDNEIPELPYAQKLLFFKQTGHSFGRSALLLSGGANMGLFHLGVIKALAEQKLLPRVISGSSAGAVAAAIIGTRTASELDSVYEPGNLDLNPWRWLNPHEMIQQKSFMDNRQLERFLRENIGEYTFEEAFKKSNRIINISVSPLSKNQRPRLLNYLTTPHLMVWSGVLASCAVPGLFPPVTLMTKDQFGVHKPYMAPIQWVDGTLKSDLPTQRLGELYNINHHIVSQTNPHVLPFIGGYSKKDGWTSFLGRLAKGEMQYRSKQLLQLAAYGIESGRIRQVLDGVYALVDQQYYGDVTIHPKVRLKDYQQIISDVSPERFQAWILAGERATWPKIAMIRDQTTVGQTLEDCIQRLKKQRPRHNHGKDSLNL